MLLDPVEDVHAHPAVHHVDGQPPFAKSTCAANPVQVCLIVWVTILVYWQVEVDHHRNLLNIDTCMRKSIWENFFIYIGGIYYLHSAVAGAPNT